MISRWNIDRGAWLLFAALATLGGCTERRELESATGSGCALRCSVCINLVDECYVDVDMQGVVKNKSDVENIPKAR